jgi:hypothetical protein
MPNFQLYGLADEPFAALFELSDEALLAQGALRRIATESPGFPCRVSLQDAEVGEELLLLPYEHQPAASPYRATGPIFVRRGARQRTLPPGFVPPYVRQRLMSLRAYDADDMMIDATVCDGADVAAWLARSFAAPAVAYVHLHNAKRGCFSCAARRAGASCA